MVRVAAWSAVVLRRRRCDVGENHEHHWPALAGEGCLRVRIDVSCIVSLARFRGSGDCLADLGRLRAGLGVGRVGRVALYAGIAFRLVECLKFAFVRGRVVLCCLCVPHG